MGGGDCAAKLPTPNVQLSTFNGGSALRADGLLERSERLAEKIRRKLAFSGGGERGKATLV